jgi:hypothetical protein
MELMTLLLMGIPFNKLIYIIEIGAIRIDDKFVESRNVKTPMVDCDRIEFDLAAW